MQNSNQILKKTMELAAAGNTVVLYTVIAADAVTNIPIGARMLVGSDLQKHGTLGNTFLDKTMGQRAQDLFEKAMPQTKIIDMSQASGNIQILEDTYFAAKKLLILGGGHIAVPLAQMAAMLGYKTTVVDDRPEFANKERFPLADQIICQGFDEYLQECLTGKHISSQTSVVIITRGHAYDYKCLAAVINSPAGYIGMIGSAGKVGHTFKLLLAQGINKEKLRQVAAPIGLDLGGQKPAEIALGILAEIIARENNGTGKPMSEIKNVVV